MTDKFYDEEEREMIEAYEKGELRPVKNRKRARDMARQAAGNYLKKNSRINIRLSDSDLQMIKIKAVEEGMPYQTLISSIIHKYVSGRLTHKNY